MERRAIKMPPSTSSAPISKAILTNRVWSEADLRRNCRASSRKLGKPDKKVSGSVTGAMHRAWIDTKANLGGGDKTILESVEQGEDKAKETYQKALSGTLPPSVSEIVRRQAASVQRAHDKVRTLRDTAQAA